MVYKLNIPNKKASKIISRYGKSKGILFTKGPEQANGTTNAVYQQELISNLNKAGDIIQENWSDFTKFLSDIKKEG